MHGVEANVDISVETSMESSAESDRSRHAGGVSALRLQLLGPLTIMRGETLLPLPASRKARALIAYLALNSSTHVRTHLCELLWESPNDPRGELRWCLSKIRGVLDGVGHKRIEVNGDRVRLDLSDSYIDVIAIERALRQQKEGGAPDSDHLITLLALFAGEFLEGLESTRSAPFNSWLLAHRRHLRACHIALLGQLVKAFETGSDASQHYLEKWLELAPFDQHVHELLLTSLALRGQWHDGDEHLQATARLFDAEGFDWRPLGHTWRTVRERHSGGTRLVPGAPTNRVTSTNLADAPAATPRAAYGRASIAIMPFSEVPAPNEPRGGIAEGLAHDLITRLAKLRCLFVIAQGTMFALHERKLCAEEASRTLNVDYLISGSVFHQARSIVVQVALSETRNAHVIWAERFERELDDALAVLNEIGDGVVASVASEIETAERNRAILKAPNSLDAWEAHHRGLWHMYRFNRSDNLKARHCFELAVRLDPGFSRAFAGLSFTYWQDAFQHWSEAAQAIDRALDAAGRSLDADERDPAAHWALGRAQWLCGQQQQSLAELGTAVELSPSFALGHYTLAFVHSQSGDPRIAIEASDHSRHLSPFDPLLFGMLGARAMALVRLGQFEEAACWAIKAAERPNAHVHILAIAAHCLTLAGRHNDAHTWVLAIRAKAHGYGLNDFFSAFHFDDATQALYRQAAKRNEIS